MISTESARRVFALYNKAILGVGFMLILFFLASISDFGGFSEDITAHLVSKSTSPWRFAIIVAFIGVLTIISIVRKTTMSSMTIAINVFMTSLGGLIGLALIVYCLVVWPGNKVPSGFMLDLCFVVILAIASPILIEIVSRTTSLKNRRDRIVAIIFVLISIAVFIALQFGSK